MSRSGVNFLLDCFLLFNFLALLVTSAVLKFIFPTAAASPGWTLWGLDFESWRLIQIGVLALMTLTVLLHLILHWTWVCGFITSRISKRVGRRLTTNEATRTLYGVGTLILILTVLGTILAAAQLTIRPPAGARATPEDKQAERPAGPMRERAG
ncbi:MAG: DUF4405 domain-containing protein [Phycisphaerae bacterium]|nr:DUF4405 domain-containing protein [Phycisphaerae bacterium]NUQ45994.1 DUF4405 domain-containing protein [Phycisphaerae bacterium]